MVNFFCVVSDSVSRHLQTSHNAAIVEFEELIVMTLKYADQLSISVINTEGGEC